MNQLLFDRSTGGLGPHAFARIQSSQRLHAILPAPSLLFDGGEKEVVPRAGATEEHNPQDGEVEEKSWTHQAGVNALAIDIDGKLYELPPFHRLYAHPNSLASGGADSSIKLWNLESIPQGMVNTSRPSGAVSR
jgi:DNA excision repair protein ERCC-8